jgi:hypothetical protein
MIEFFISFDRDKDNMTDINPSTPVRRLDFSRILSVLFQPQRTFTEIAGETSSSWLTPMLALSISASLVVFVGGYLKAHAAMMGEVSLPADWQYWTPNMQNNWMQGQQATQGAVFVYIMPLVSALAGLWLGWLILGGLLHLGSTLLGGRGSMQGALSIAGWANLPFFVRDALRVVFMLIAGHAIASPGLSGFAGSAVFLAKLISQLDIFFVWNAILLVMGFGIADGLPKNKAIIGVVAVLLILLLALSGMGALISNLGGTLTS